MRARENAASNLELAAEQTIVSNRQSPNSPTAERQFDQYLQLEYQLEALQAGFNTAEAAEYASALSPDLGLIVDGSEPAPVGPGWHYQARPGLARRTVSSGLLTRARWERIKAIGRSSGAGTRIFGFESRPWNADGSS
jgi:hypothetical protein